MKKVIVILSVALASYLCLNAKKVLDHSCFDGWKGVRISALSNNGKWAVYAVNPQEGDGILTFRNTSTGRQIEIPRGASPSFTADSKWGVALIKPFYADTRKAKIDKKKDFDMPQDSLAIVNLTTGGVQKIPNVLNYKVGKKGGDWITYQSCDTTMIRPKALKDKKAGRPLVLKHLSSGVTKIIPWSKEYTVSEDGRTVATSIVHHKSDSTAYDGMGAISLPDTAFILVDRDKKHYGAPVISPAGDKLAYVVSNDTVETGTRKYDLFLYNLKSALAEPEQVFVPATTRKGVNYQRPRSNDPEMQTRLEKQWREKMAKAAGDSVFINQYSRPFFSENGKRLIVGVAPYVCPDDTTIVPFERAELDIWRWDAPYTPPQEKVNLEKMRKHTYPVAVDLATMKSVLLTAEPLAEVVSSDRWNSRTALLRDPSVGIVSQQWDYLAPEDLYTIDLETGERQYAVTVPIENSSISPKGNYLYWYNDRDYYVYDTRSGETRCLTEEIEVPLWNEEQDIPMKRNPYGVMAWTADDDALLVYDRYDIWSLDPAGKRKPLNLTKGNGRKNFLRYRYVKTDPDRMWISTGDDVLLSVFDYNTKRNGFATMKGASVQVPVLRTLEENSFTQVRKAKNADVYAFQKSNFSTSPDVYISTSDDLAKAKKVTDANPQMKDYNWGEARLVKWYAYNGDLTEGVLYTPEDLDPSGKYPMLVVFYERNSEELYAHYTMEPSWSWVNYPFYVSRGYVVFVPDVKYAPGIPGESAYNYICSGVEDLCKKYPWIDKDKIGIDGQSWGGYQTSYLITRTNMFACAGSGAPVSNMTSAYGGIRWGTGDSRQGQYELGQSRIGRTLWEAPQLYMANSPIFFADRVNTPLLIMHNDADGAVPWYQGIEYFMGLRRLGKPVWMLQYNGEAHNIKARKNRKDITIRLQQFFDHYLKGAPMPKWMKEGIPMTRKGQEMATELIEEETVISE